MAGLHGRAERGPRGVTVYLLPGLTAWQRRAVIRRLRQEASRGFGPALPLPQLAVALGLDRVRTAARIAGAIVRLHPAVTLVPGAFVVALMTLFVIASGDRPGLAPGTRARARGRRRRRSVARALGTPSGPARAARVTADQGTAVTVAGGTGPGSGRSAVAPRLIGPRPRTSGTPRAGGRDRGYARCLVRLLADDRHRGPAA